MSTHRARSLRKQMTPPERRLWSTLKARPQGYKFRRQHPMGPYIFDFFCHETSLAIEVDGFAHDFDSVAKHDLRRDAWAAEQGVLTLRIGAKDVRDNLEAVLALIVEKCRQRAPRRDCPSTAIGGPPPLQMQGRIGAAS